MAKKSSPKQTVQTPADNADPTSSSSKAPSSSSGQLSSSFDLAQYQAELKVLVALAALSLIIYSQAINFNFINFDDDRYVFTNEMLQTGINWTSIKWAFTTYTMGHWHPITWLSLLIDHQFFGLRPTGYHLTNIVLHMLNGALLFILLRYSTGKLLPSALVAAIFIAHPIHVEPVAWVSSRKDLLSAFFGLITLIIYTHYSRQPRWTTYLLTLCCFALSLMSKSMLITLPAVMILFDYWPLNRYAEQQKLSAYLTRLIKLTLEKVPFFALSVLCIIMATKAQFTTLAALTEKTIIAGKESPWSESLFTIANRFNNYFTYLFKTFWPSNLSVYYPIDPYPIPIKVFTVLAIFIIVTALAIWQWRKMPYLIVGWLIYLGMLLPISNLLLADRYLYFPLIGISIALVWVGFELTERFQIEQITRFIAGFAIIALTLVATVQVSYWRDTIVLFEHAIAVTEDNMYMYYNLGIEYIQRNNLAEAEKQFKKALTYNAQYVAPLNDLGTILMQQNRLDEALEYYNRAIAAQPDTPEIHFNLGKIFLQMKQLDKAVSHFEKATALSPQFMEAHNMLGGAYLEMGNFEAATKAFQQALQLKPDSVDIKLNLALMKIKQGKIEEGIQEYNSLLNYCPALDRPRNYYNLANALYSKGRLTETIAYYEKALELNPNFIQARQNLDYVKQQLPKGQ